jgi:hypothetical protein
VYIPKRHIRIPLPFNFDIGRFFKHANLSEINPILHFKSFDFRDVDAYKSNARDVLT